MPPALVLCCANRPPSFCVCVFLQGTSLVLGPLNYLFVHTFNSGKYCLGVFDNGRAGECQQPPAEQAEPAGLVV